MVEFKSLIIILLLYLYYIQDVFLCKNAYVRLYDMCTMLYKMCNSLIYNTINIQKSIYEQPVFTLEFTTC